MHVIVIGAGKVGYSIAEKLSKENHDVYLIDYAEERMEIIQENLDIQTILGYGASIETLNEAGIEKADILMAVTNNDEVNIMACLLAKEYGVKKTVARVGRPEYIKSDYFKYDAWGIDLVINPELVTAETIKRLIEVPEALNVEYFAHGKVQMLEVRVEEGAAVVGKRLEELEMNHSFLVVALLREETMIVPRGSDSLQAGDNIFVIAATERMIQIEKLMGKVRFNVEEVTILGGGRVGFNLAQILEETDIKVKLIERDYQKCQRLTEKLTKTLVIHGDGGDLQLLEDEDVGKGDIFIAVTGDDKLNLLVSLMAKHLGVEKTIAQIRRSDYIPLVEKVGIDIPISPRMLTASAILKHIRRGKIVSVTLIGGAQAEFLEVVAPDRGKIVKKPLKNIRFPRGMIIGAIARGDNIIIPSGDDTICPGDRVMVFALPEAVRTAEKIFDGR